MEKRLAELEESCRGKEAERVDLEIRLTEVKENLKKSLASGELGIPAEKKPANKVCVPPALSSVHRIPRGIKTFSVSGHLTSNGKVL